MEILKSISLNEMLNEVFPGPEVDVVNFAVLRDLLDAMIKQLYWVSFPQSNALDKGFGKSDAASIQLVNDLSNLPPNSSAVRGVSLQSSNEQSNNIENRSSNASIITPPKSFMILKSSDSIETIQSSRIDQHELFEVANSVTNEAINEIINKMPTPDVPVSTYLTKETIESRGLVGDAYPHASRSSKKTVSTKLSTIREDAEEITSNIPAERKSWALIPSPRKSLAVIPNKELVHSVPNISQNADKSHETPFSFEPGEFFDEFVDLAGRVAKLENQLADEDVDSKVYKIIELMEQQQNYTQSTINDLIGMVETKADRKDLNKLEAKLKSNETKSSGDRKPRKSSLKMDQSFSEKQPTKPRPAATNSHPSYFCNRLTNVQANCSCDFPVGNNHVPVSTSNPSACFCPHSYLKGTDGLTYHSICTCRFSQ